MFEEEQYRQMGHNIPVRSRKPVELEKDQSVWVILAGEMDVYVGKTKNGADGDRYVGAFGRGSFIFKLPSMDDTATTAVYAFGTEETELIEIQKDVLEESPVDIDHMSEAIEWWMKQLSQTVPSRFPYTTVDIEEKKEVEENTNIVSSKYVIWVRPVDGIASFVGDDRWVMAGESWLPLTKETWMHTWQRTEIEQATTRHLIQTKEIWHSLEQFHTWMAWADESLRKEKQTQQFERLEQRRHADQRFVTDSLYNMVSVLEKVDGEKAAPSGEPPALTVCRYIGKSLNVEIHTPSAMKNYHTSAPLLKDILKASRLRTREVMLEHGWWKGDHGPMIAYEGESSQLVALLPKRPGTYEKINTATGERRMVNAKEARTLDPKALYIYRPFPNRSLGIKDLFKQSSVSIWKMDIVLLVVFACGFGALSLFIPFTTGYLFDNVIPRAQENVLVHLFFILLVTAIVQFAFQISQGFALLRLEGKAETAIQSAVWDRILSLPAPFFRDFLAGDLAERALTISQIRQILTQVSMITLLSMMTILFNAALMFYYSAALAVTGLTIVILAVLMISVLGYMQVQYSRHLLEAKGEISGLLLQVFQGVSKLKTSVAEKKAFSLWARPFTKQRNNSIKIRSIQNYVEVIMSVLPLVSSMVLFYMMINTSTLSAGMFLGFNAAFSAVMMSMVSMSTLLMPVLEIFPMLERAKPILKAEPEVDENKESPGELVGSIELAHVSFRYDKNMAMLLKDIQLRVQPEEFAAIVGPSGSGKSTLLRLLLGFEQPESGSIFYDDKDLGHVDVREVRQQLGVVLQDSKLMSGSVLENIIGATNRSLEDAWKAARMAGFEKDIKEMPMGMHTVVGEGGGSLSGGQRQRLLIARALINNPKLVFFDEATSALDNHTQKLVMDSLEKLRATRIVIAHRLSTIANADRIFVLEHGQLVETGTYEQLIEKDGLFKEMVRRQLA
ncbi:NHLP bacteriocin export ABC transporter permease/ATPase subunit [Salibacterium sp. K-3]